MVSPDQFDALTYWTLWITAAAMGVGTIILYIKGRNMDTDEGREHAVVSIFIPAIAATMYLAMALGFGVSRISLVGGEEQLVFWGRYADWVITTPLLLLDLALFAGADRETIGTLLGLDVMMIVTGFFAASSAQPVNRYVWWAVSTGAFVVILYAIFTKLPKFASAYGDERASSLGTLRNLLAVLWFVYPLLWLVGTEGASVVPLGVETVGYAVLDVTAKVVFGYALLSSVGSLAPRRRETETGAGVTADD
ncbi:bacteriorhodopsin [Halorussus lipolyticus]|uniref:bacteriorhodopsin n=1 Tax=Halorussus lipolyticus TaxID=3034024 RepID=UPI0023E81FAE|nr:bacteriorhodopsin [Halorussus sp. DT80]